MASFRPGVVISVSMLLLSGCSSIAPNPLTPADSLAEARETRERGGRGVEPLTGPLSLPEAVARGLKYNLDQRIRLRERELALGLWKAGNYDLLPRAMATATHRSRDKDLITRSTDSVTGLPSLAHPYISSERSYELYNLGLSWSLLDFGVGYYTAKQNANRVLIAAEHRRKAMHTLTRDITVAYWRLVGAQKLIEDVRGTIRRAEEALADLSTAKDESIRAPLDNLRYQRQLLENIRLLVTIEKDFAGAKASLCSLINLPPNAELVLVEPSAAPNVEVLNAPVGRMEEIAFMHNADLREKSYDRRNAVAEARKGVAKLLPNISLNYDYRYNTDSYLINSTWNEAGIQVSFNLINLLSARSQLALGKAGVELAADRQLALQMALLTQVHIARIELAASYRQYQLADRIWVLDRDIKQLSANREEAHADSKLSRIASEATSIVSLLRRYQAVVDFNIAASSLQATLGLEPQFGSVSDTTLADLTRAVNAHQEAWQSGRLSIAQ